MEQAISINTHHVEQIRELLFANPQWGRTRLSVELCKQWDWKSPSGQYKDMACRSLLLNLASHILSRIARRISDNWRQKYGHPVYLLETFVDRSLFKGVCYQAANWILTGQTKGRTRNDRNHDIQAPVKDIYLYPLIKDFRRRLCSL
jgi:hypothetical protein